MTSPTNNPPPKKNFGCKVVDTPNYWIEVTNRYPTIGRYPQSSLREQKVAIGGDDKFTQIEGNQPTTESVG